MSQATPDLQINASPIVIGVDEAGRGPLAGPVVAAAVVLGQQIPAGVADSKKLSAKRRARLDEELRAACLWAVAVVEPEEIDRLNIFGATMEAMTRCVGDLVAQLDEPPQIVLIDGNQTPERRCGKWRWPARAIVKGDAKETVIGAASIIAKEWRDRIIVKAARAYPQYGWERNKGYPTREHLEALGVHGPTPLHRQSFAPVAQARLL
ncbi:MAG: ribonuclease HII [Pseudomonadota bacterium]